MKSWVQGAVVVVLAILGIGIGWAVWGSSPGTPKDAGPGPGAETAVAAAPSRGDANKKESAAASGPTEAAEREAARSAAPRVAGRVVDIAGKPVAGARITAASYPLTASLRVSEISPRRSSLSAADGHFEIPLLERETSLMLAAEAEGFAPEVVESATAAGETTIRLERSVAVVGKVVNETGAPVPGARVSWSASFDFMGFERTAVAGADGSYRIEGLPSLSGFARSAWLRMPRFDVRADGYAPVSLDEFSASPAPRGVIARDFVLNVGVRLRGRVVDEDTGDPIADARVLVWVSGGSAGSGSPGRPMMRNPYYARQLLETKSAADGSFGFEHAPGESLHLREGIQPKKKAADLIVVAAGYAPQADPIDAERAGSIVEKKVGLRPAATVRGRVVDEKGEPFADVSVSVPRMSKQRSWVPGDAVLDANGATKSRADGTYEITSAEAVRGKDTPSTVRASYESEPVRANASRPAGARLEVPITLRVGAVTEAEDLVLPRVALGAIFPYEMAVEVTVVDAAGIPVPNVTLDSIPNVGLEPRAVTGSNGTARLRISGDTSRGAKEDGSRRIAANAAGYARGESESFEFRKGQTQTIQITMKPGGSIRGVVLGSDGAPAPACTVVAWPPGIVPKNPAPGGQAQSPRDLDPSYTFANAVTREDGSFEIAGLPEGTSMLRATRFRRGASGKPEEVHATVEGVTTGANDVVIRFTNDADAPAGSLDLEVTDAATQKPILKIAAALLRDGRTFYGPSTLPGRARFDAVIPGEYELRVWSAGYAQDRGKLVRIAADANETISVALGRGAVVRGRVRVPSGVPPVRLFVNLDPTISTSYMGERIPTATVDAAGNYRIEAVAPGTWRVSVTEPFDGRGAPAGKWGLPKETSVTVGASGSETVCDLDLVPCGSLGLRLNTTHVNLTGFGPPATDAQCATAAKSALTIQGADGHVFFLQRGLDHRTLWDRIVPEGEVVVRVEIAGQPPVEKRVTVVAGKRVYASIDVP